MRIADGALQLNVIGPKKDIEDSSYASTIQMLAEGQSLIQTVCITTELGILEYDKQKGKKFWQLIFSIPVVLLDTRVELFPPEGVFAYHRTGLHLKITQAELRDCADFMERHMHVDFMFRLQHITIDLHQPLNSIHACRPDRNLLSLKTIFQTLRYCLNEVTIYDESLMLGGAIVPETICSLVADTSITYFKLGRPLSQEFTDTEKKSLPNLCCLNTRYDDDPKRFHFEWASRRRDLWGYLCFALSFVRANRNSVLYRSYVPLVRTIADQLGWTNAYGALTLYKLNQQTFCEKWFDALALQRLAKGRRRKRSACNIS